MSFAARALPLFALLAAPFCAPAHASDYEVGASLVCDTQEQVEHFVAQFTGDAQAAIQYVNDEEKNPLLAAERQGIHGLIRTTGAAPCW